MRRIICAVMVLLLLLALLAAVGASAWYINKQDNDPLRLMQEIEEETDSDRQRLLMAVLTRRVGPEQALQLLNNSSLPKAGASHLLAHSVGEVAYELYKQEALPYCREDVRSGCSHGLFTVAIAEMGSEGIGRMIDACRKWSAFAYTMCLHAAGHAFTALSGYDIFVALGQCDRILGPTEVERHRCWSGVFMENAHGVHGGLIPPLHPYLSAADPMRPCTLVVAKYKTACYYNQAGWWYADIFARDMRRTAEECEKVPAQYQYACYDNVARLISTQEKNDVEGMTRECRLLPSRWQDECLMSIAISAYSQGDEELPFDLCRAVASESVQRSCYERLERDFRLHELSDEAYRRLCKKFASSYRDMCDGGNE